MGEHSDVSDRLSLLAATVAHDFCNSLFVISGSTESLLRRAADERSRDLCRGILEEIGRLTELAMELSRRGPEAAALEPVSLRDICHEVESSLEALGDGMSVGVRIELEADLPSVLGNHGYVRRALEHVLTNAIQFAGAGGSVVVWGRAVEDAAVIHVEDSGSGIPVELRDRVFERFFTTRPESALGLGLTSARRLVELCEGRVELVEPERLGGAAVALRFSLS